MLTEHVMAHVIYIYTYTCFTITDHVMVHVIYIRIYIYIYMFYNY